MDPTLVTIQNNIDVQRAVQTVIAEANAARPKNTIKNYEPKQKEWMAWCSQRAFQDGCLVSEGKLLLFLREVVEARGNRKRIAGEIQTITAEGMEGYAKALVDLWRTQKALDPSLMIAHPRGATVKAYLTGRKRSAAKRKVDMLEDRGAGTIQDTYNEEEMRRMSQYYLRSSTQRGLRDRLDFLLGHALIARGETTRYIQLPNLFSMEMKNEGPTVCNALMVIMRQGKTNVNGRIDYGGCMRHRNALLCPVGALALYLFWRFQVAMEPFPNLGNRAEWYNISLIEGRDRTKQASYSMQAANMKKAMKACGITSSKVTHSKRSSSTVMTEAGGASEAQIRRAGRWNSEKMEGCYLTTLPKKALRALAGFNPNGGSFLLERATVDVPEVLVQQVFPSLSQWDAGKIDDIAGQGFVKLLLYLRTVLLQDAPGLMRDFPHHGLWCHPVFQCDEFKAYASQVLEAIHQAPVSVPQSVEAAMPVMTNVVQAGLSHVSDRMGILEKQIERVDEKISSMMKYGFTMTFNAPAGHESPSTESSARVATTSTAAPAVTVYKQSRQLRTISEIWEEYATGLDGGPAVRDLEASFGVQWRKEECDRRFYSPRKVYYDAIASVSAALRISPAQAVERLDMHRTALGMSLDAFAKMVKESGAVTIVQRSTTNTN